MSEITDQPGITLDGSDLGRAMDMAWNYGAWITPQTMTRAIEAALSRHKGVSFIWPAGEKRT